MAGAAAREKLWLGATPEELLPVLRAFRWNFATPLVYFSSTIWACAAAPQGLPA